MKKHLSQMAFTLANIVILLGEDCMGAWGVLPFENDDAPDWVADFEAQPTLDFLQETLSAALEASYIEEDVANAAIAAAPVAAALRGYKILTLPEQ